jgi:hypothetical protein
MAYINDVRRICLQLADFAAEFFDNEQGLIALPQKVVEIGDAVTLS